MSLWKYLGPIGALGSAIQNNQAKQKRKGAIGEAYRVNVARMDTDQAGVRQDTNEGLNARGVLSAGGVQGAPPMSPIAAAVASGGPKFGSLAPYEAGASRGAVGPANTLSGGVNSALSDQFALERKDLQDENTQQRNENQRQYVSSIGTALEQGIDTYANFARGGSIPQSPPDLGPSPAGTQITPSAPTGAYGMPTIPDFSTPPAQIGANKKTSFGTSDTPNYAFGTSS